jgi:hypothetical protein
VVDSEARRQVINGDRAGPRVVMQSCSCVRARTRGRINNERGYALLRSVAPCRGRESDSDAAKAPDPECPSAAGCSYATGYRQ